MKQKTVPLLVVLVCVSVASFGISAAVRRRLHLGVALQTPLKITTHPYTISSKLYGTAAGVTQAVLGVDRVRAVRADGSTAESTISYRGDGSILRRERILSLVGGVRVRTDEGVSLMTVTKNSAEDGVLAGGHFDPAQSCIVTFGEMRFTTPPIVSQENLLGYQTYKIATTMGRYRNTVWRAPALGCAELRRFGEKLDPVTNQVIATSDEVATEIRTGEPDPTLFSLPTGFRNVAPSELTAASAAACCNGKLNDMEEARLKPADDHFRQFRFDP